MSRPKQDGNLRSRVLYTRDAYNTLIAALHMWGIDCSVALQMKTIDATNALQDIGTSLGFGDFVGSDLLGRPQTKPFDENSDENDWKIPDFIGEAANIGPGRGAVDWTAGVETSDTPVLGTYQLITLEKAAEWFTNEFLRAMNKHNLASIKRVAPGRRGRYRAMCHWVRSKVRSGVYLKLGIERLKAVCLTQRRRIKGPQIIQTKRPITAGYYQSFRFNGTHAIRLPQGRPALSKAEWLRRYKLRKQSEKKTDRTRSNPRQKIVPTPKHGRPSRAIETAIQTHKPAVVQYVSDPAFETDFEFDWGAFGKEFLSETAKEIGKVAGEAVGDWASEKLENLLQIEK